MDFRCTNNREATSQDQKNNLPYDSQMRNRLWQGLINDRLAKIKGLTGFDSVRMAKGDGSGQLNGKTVEMYTAQRIAA